MADIVKKRPYACTSDETEGCDIETTDDKADILSKLENSITEHMVETHRKKNCVSIDCDPLNGCWALGANGEVDKIYPNYVKMDGKWQRGNGDEGFFPQAKARSQWYNQDEIKNANDPHWFFDNPKHQAYEARRPYDRDGYSNCFGALDPRATRVRLKFDYTDAMGGRIDNHIKTGFEKYDGERWNQMHKQAKSGEMRCMHRRSKDKAVVDAVTGDDTTFIAGTVVQIST